MLFRAHGRFVESLGGRYVTAEDVGTSTADMDFVHMETDYVTGLTDRSGDPSPVTARGVFRAIQASAKWRWDDDDLTDRAVAIQGCGHVGYYLAQELHTAGARLIVTDIDTDRVKRVVTDFNARAVKPDDIYCVERLFAPCGVRHHQRRRFRSSGEIVAGAANNPSRGPARDALEEREIFTLPNFAMRGASYGTAKCRWDAAAARKSTRSTRPFSRCSRSPTRCYPAYTPRSTGRATRSGRGSLVKTWPVRK